MNGVSASSNLTPLSPHQNSTWFSSGTACAFAAVIDMNAAISATTMTIIA
jgi:hypothetical protein